MIDTREETKLNFRQAGRIQGGKIAKGPLQDPINKTTTASIPYKFETILYKNTNPKGFGASSQRVNRNEDLGPGPGSYDYEHAQSRSNTASMSKKGYGNGFVSQATRLLYRGYINTGPGPGAYNFVAKPFQVTHIVHDNKKDSSEELIKSKALQTDLPGPGYYNSDVPQGVPRRHNPNSVFKSGTGRYNTATNLNPPPGSYEIDRSLSEKKPFKHFLGSANFMLPAKKKMSKEAEDKQAVNTLLGKDDVLINGLGPGQYFRTDKEDELVLFNQKVQDKNNHNFMIGNTTRFGEVIQRKVKRVENPGPGTYIPVGVTEDKTLVSGAVFMSETARRPFRDVKNFVGPMKYNPELLPKKSYHLNINKIWV